VVPGGEVGPAKRHLQLVASEAFGVRRPGSEFCLVAQEQRQAIMEMHNDGLLLMCVVYKALMIT